MELKFVKRPGNRNWGKMISPQPIVPTEFEVQAQYLKLLPKDYAESAELRQWCERNRNRLYVPEWLLEAWEMEVDPVSS